MSDDYYLRTARLMAWSRAKGELESMLDTFWSSNGDEQFKSLKAAISDFIQDIEDRGIQE